ncbi:MAG: hypothetical protein CML56_09885 [Rhodobacteraceae bacterium]|nr:hypothetical protein [Paracoccaceae bacterium]
MLGYRGRPLRGSPKCTLFEAQREDLLLLKGPQGPSKALKLNGWERAVKFIGGNRLDQVKLENGSSLV